MKGLKISISGLVQGIGFRPFVYRIAVQRGLKGCVRNMGDAGVEIEVHGGEEAIRAFLIDLVEMKPPIAIYTDFKEKWVDYDDSIPGFTIVESHLSGKDVKQSIIPFFRGAKKLNLRLRRGELHFRLTTKCGRDHDFFRIFF